MTNEMIISESQSLYSDIDCCITELLKARTEHNSENEGKALFKMESLMVSTLQHLACIIEQPSLPSNLDEAAQKFAVIYDRGTCDGIAQDCFKAGAEWMAGQGVTKEAVIGMATEEISINVSQHTLDELNLCPGDKVVVQIRKEDIVI